MKRRNEIRFLIEAYNHLVKGIERIAEDDEERAYGGIIRAGKGVMVENLCRHVIEIAWKEAGGDPGRLSFEKQARVIPLKRSYLERLKVPEVRAFLAKNIERVAYRLKLDVHVHVDNAFVMGVECKAYTENAMFKRILVDFTLMKSVVPDIACVLFQLESQLGGDYSEVSKDIILGSKQTHTLLSYFDVDLNIVTLLEGERKVDRPIHKEQYFKELREQSITRAVGVFKNLLRPHV